MKPVISEEDRRNDASQMLIDDGMNVFVIKAKHASPNEMLILGFEGVTVRPYTNPNTGNTTFHKSPVKGGFIKFIPDRYGVPVAHIPDTPHNRNRLAADFWSKQYEISSLLTPNGTVVGPVIRSEMEKLAIAAGAKPPSDADKMKVRIEAGKKEEVKKLTPEEVVAHVEQENELLLRFIKHKYGNDYKKSPEFKEVFRPLIEKALNSFGYTKEVLAAMKAERENVKAVSGETNAPIQNQEEESSLLKA